MERLRVGSCQLHQSSPLRQLQSTVLGTLPCGGAGHLESSFQRVRHTVAYVECRPALLHLDDGATIDVTLVKHRIGLCRFKPDVCGPFPYGCRTLGWHAEKEILDRRVVRVGNGPKPSAGSSVYPVPAREEPTKTQTMIRTTVRTANDDTMQRVAHPKKCIVDPDR